MQRYSIIALSLALTGLAGVSYADCPAVAASSNNGALPVASEGKISYDAVAKTVLVCDGTAWKTLVTTEIGYSAEQITPGMMIDVPAYTVPGGTVVPAFKVMKYEARRGVGNTAISKPTGSFAPADATYCTGLGDRYTNMSHLQRASIAHQIASDARNWSGGAVGTGQLYRGHSDNVPTGAQAASSDDSDGYYLTGNDATTGFNQRRTLYLPNNEVIWDFSGNHWEALAWGHRLYWDAHPYSSAGAGATDYSVQVIMTTVYHPYRAIAPYAPANSHTLGLGLIHFLGAGAGGASGAIIAAGGNFNYAYAGVFASLINEGTGATIRCVYNP